MEGLVWNKIQGIKNDFNYYANLENGVLLPNPKELVIICMNKNNKDFYVVGYFEESKYGVHIVLPYNGLLNIENGMQWAYFNKPITKNNLMYGIAYLDENGNNFMQDIPNMIEIGNNKDLFLENIKELENKGFTQITPFSFISPCSYNYNWDYINSHKVSINLTASELISMLEEKISKEEDKEIVIPTIKGEISPNYIASQDDNFLLCRI